MKAVIPVLSNTNEHKDSTSTKRHPVFVQPAVHAAVEEALACRCEEIVIVSESGDGPGFEAAGWHHAPGASAPARIRLVRHAGPVSIGKALLAAAPYLDGSPFMVIAGDATAQDGLPSMADLIDVQRETAGAVLAVRSVRPGDDLRLGSVDVGHGGGRLHPVLDLFDTPLPHHVITQRALMGRLVLTKEIAEGLLTAKDGTAPEAILHAALAKAIRESCVYAVEPLKSAEPLTSRAAARAARGLGTPHAPNAHVPGMVATTSGV